MASLVLLVLFFVFGLLPTNYFVKLLARWGVPVFWRTLLGAVLLFILTGMVGRWLLPPIFDFLTNAKFLLK